MLAEVGVPGIRVKFLGKFHKYEFKLGNVFIFICIRFGDPNFSPKLPVGFNVITLRKFFEIKAGCTIILKSASKIDVKIMDITGVVFMVRIKFV